MGFNPVERPTSPPHGAGNRLRHGSSAIQIHGAPRRSVVVAAALPAAEALTAARGRARVASGVTPRGMADPWR
jgi:hypothetical protein